MPEHNLTTWVQLLGKRFPAGPSVNMEMLAFYKNNMFLQTGSYTAGLKLFFQNDWQCVDVGLRKCDVDYLKNHCSTREDPLYSCTETLP